MRYVVAALLCCGSALAYEPDYGPNPQLPEPEFSLFPTVKVAPAVGWAKGAQPLAANGLKVQAFARDLDHPRWICVLPNGDVLVAETNAPSKRPKEDEGLRGWAAKHIMKKAGAGVESADRITLLRDTDGDGVADQRSTFAEKLYSPFGMALVGDRLFIADSDAVVSVGYEKDALKAKGEPKKLVDLPAGEFNHHWTKSLIANRDGTKLYVGVGSNSNVGENGMDNEVGRAAIWEIDVQTGAHRIFASGIRNPIGLAWEPTTGALWVTVNERDELGNLLVPDYITSVKDGGFYGWPFSYYGAHVDERIKPQRPELVAKAIVPDYAIGAHTASLGLAAARGNSLPPRFAEGMFVGQHGSWNRKPPVGYKVVFVPFKDGKPAGPPEDVLTGFLSADGDAQGRPVGVALDGKGSLLVADDVGNTIWRVSAAK